MTYKESYTVELKQSLMPPVEGFLAAAIPICFFFNQTGF